jgi:hypothetical protein
MRLLWTGSSVLDGSPLFVAATDGSHNRKTGPMVQVWILRADVHPLQAVRTGQDAAICGDCALRGVNGGHGRSCYVPVQHAPAAVYRSYHDGRYEDVRGFGDLFAGEIVRIGAYGDPAAVPFTWWSNRLEGWATAWTAYTHQWRRCDPRFRRLCMASVETAGDAEEAQAAGWRTFRVRSPLSPLQPGEITCPASDEAGHRTTCARCRLCDGARRDDQDHRRKDIAIFAHRTPLAFARQAQGPLFADDMDVVDSQPPPAPDSAGGGWG